MVASYSCLFKMPSIFNVHDPTTPKSVFHPVNAVLENLSSVHPLGNIQVYKKYTHQV